MGSERECRTPDRIRLAPSRLESRSLPRPRGLRYYVSFQTCMICSGERVGWDMPNQLPHIPSELLELSQRLEQLRRISRRGHGRRSQCGRRQSRWRMVAPHEQDIAFGLRAVEETDAGWRPWPTCSSASARRSIRTCCTPPLNRLINSFCVFRIDIDTQARRSLIIPPPVILFDRR